MEPCFFSDDIVIGQSSNGRTRYGVIERTSVIEPDEEDSDSSFEEIESGYVCLSWYPDGRRETIVESKLQLVDRAIFPRDVVRQRTATQSGTVFDINVFCDVMIVGTEKRINNIDSSLLEPVYPLLPNDLIAHGSWFGQVQEIHGSLILRFCNGARASLSISNCDDLLDDLSPHPSDAGLFTDTSEYLYYPGQALSGYAKDFKDGHWLEGKLPRDKSRIKAIVEQVRLYSIEVKWLAQSGSKEILEKTKKNIDMSNGGKENNTTDANGTNSQPAPQPRADQGKVNGKDETWQAWLSNEVETPTSLLVGDQLMNVRVLKRFWKGHISPGKRYMYRLSEADIDNLNKKSNPKKKMKRSKRQVVNKRSDRKIARINLSESNFSFFHKDADGGYHNYARSKENSTADDPSKGCNKKIAKENTERNEQAGEHSSTNGELVMLAEGGEHCVATDDLPPKENLGSEMVFKCKIGNIEVIVKGSVFDGFFPSVSSSSVYSKHTLKIFSDSLKNRLFRPEAWKGCKSRQEISVKICSILKNLVTEVAPFETNNLSCMCLSDDVNTTDLSDDEGDPSDVEEVLEGETNVDIRTDTTKPVENGTGNTVSAPVAAASTDDDNYAAYFGSSLATKRQNGSKAKHIADDHVAVEVFSSRTLADIHWQDGSISRKVPSTSLLPLHHIDEKDYCPGVFVCKEKLSESAEPSLRSEPYGVVLTAESANRIVSVQWLQYNYTTCKVEMLQKEELSVYEVTTHPHFQFRTSDIIIRLGDDETPELQKDEPVIGELLRVKPSGTLLIHWADGSESEIYPQEALLLDLDDIESLSESSDSEDSWHDSDKSWETVSSGSDSTAEAKVDRSTVATEPPHHANRSAAVNGQKLSSKQNEKMDQDVAKVVSVEQSATDADSSKGECGVGEGNSTEESRSSSESTSNNTKGSQVFVESTVAASHYFFESKFNPSVPKVFMRALKRDLVLLQTTLPNGVYVKTYEDRMDLMSLLFEGPRCTPYEDGLFAFDVQLPGDYPHKPPIFHYISYSNRLNPNLYEDGNVCVSLLGTWSGKGNEVWTKDSNLLQVIVSIQGLILNDEPYYNEAGYEGHRGTSEGIKNSRCYNELVMLRLLQHMRCLFMSPPLAFPSLSLQLCKVHIPRLIQRVTQIISKSAEDFENQSLPVKEASSPGNSLAFKSQNINGTATVTIATSKDKIGCRGEENATCYQNFSLGYPLFPVSKGALMSIKNKVDQLIKATDGKMS